MNEEEYLKFYFNLACDDFDHKINWQEGLKKYSVVTQNISYVVYDFENPNLTKQRDFEIYILNIYFFVYLEIKDLIYGFAIYYKKEIVVSINMCYSQ